MFNESQTQRIARHATDALIRAFDELPRLIENTEPEAAAAIVADMLKAQLTKPAAESDPAAELKRIIQMAEQCAEAEDRGGQDND